MTSQTLNYEQSKRKVNTKNIFYFVSLITISSIVLLSIFLTFNTNSFSNKFYLIEIEQFSSYLNAQNFIKNSPNPDQQFCIYFDEKYRVFSHLFLTHKDAETQIKKLKKSYPKASAYTLEISTFKEQKNLTKKENSIVENFVSVVVKHITTSSKKFSHFNQQKIKYEEMNFHLKNQHSNFKDAYDDLLKLFNRFGNFTTTKKYVDRIKSSIENLKNFSEEHIQKLFHFELINLAINLNYFLSCF